MAQLDVLQIILRDRKFAIMVEMTTESDIIYKLN